MIVCADDYGLREDINGSILKLCDAGKLSAVSCMVVLGRCTSASLAELRKRESHIDIGLHLCLTDEGRPQAVLAPGAAEAHPFPGFGVLFRQSLSRRLQPVRLFSEISRQHQTFVEKCGRSPDYIDGHLHVHQLPLIGEALIRFTLSLPVVSRPYIRNTRLPLRDLKRRRLPWLKSSFIGFFGKRMLALLDKASLPTNRGFAGVYDFRQWERYEQYLPKFLDCLPQANGLLVVHPGMDENWRRQEFETVRRFGFPSGMPNRFQSP